MNVSVCSGASGVWLGCNTDHMADDPQQQQVVTVGTSGPRHESCLHNFNFMVNKLPWLSEYGCIVSIVYCILNKFTDSGIDLFSTHLALHWFVYMVGLLSDVWLVSDMHDTNHTLENASNARLSLSRGRVVTVSSSQHKSMTSCTALGIWK